MQNSFNIYYDFNIENTDDLKNKVVRGVGELMQNHLFELIEELIINLKSSIDSFQEKYFRQKEIRKFEHELNIALDLTKGFRKFFSDNPLSQLMDDTNSLSELTHKRRLTSFGVGGLNKENVKLEIREIHPSHFGRVCPIETSEGKNAGLVLSLAKDIRVNALGFLESPFYF